MASQTPSPRLLVELSPQSVQLAMLDAAGRLQAFAECAASPAAVAGALAQVAPGGVPAEAGVSWIPAAGVILRSTAEEAASIRAVKSLQARAETAAHALPAPVKAVAFDGQGGGCVETVGDAPWVLAAVSEDHLNAARERLAGLGLNAGPITLALPARIGAVVAALQDMPESTRVLVWQPGENDGQLAVVSGAGCEAAATGIVGFNRIFEAVQAGLGLKFRTAAAKLFFNEGYDFSEASGPIAERVAALLRPEIAALSCPPSALYVAGLPAAQAWFAKAVASALDIVVLEPDMAALASQRGQSGDVPGGGLPASALGLLFEATAPRAGSSVWMPAWLDASAPVIAPAPAARPVVSPVVTPVTPKPVPAPVPVAAAGAVQKPAPAPKPAAVPPAAQPFPVAKASPAPAPVPKPAGTTAPFPAPKAAPAPVAKPAVAPPPAKPAPAPAVAPAAAPAKKPFAIWAAVAGLLVLGAAGIFLATRRGEATPEAAQAAPAVSATQSFLREQEEARMMEEEAKTPRSFRNDRYSFSVSDRGFLEKVVGVGNRTLIDEFGWLELQGTSFGDNKPFNLGSIAESGYKTTISKGVREGRVVFEIKGQHPRFAVSTLVTCLPASVLIETVFTPVNLSDPRGPVVAVYSVKMNRQSLSLGQRGKLEPGAITFSTQSGPAVIRINGEVWGQAGEAGKQVVAVGSNLVFFTFAANSDPQKSVLRAELVLP